MVHNHMDKLTLTRQFGIQFDFEVSERNWNVIISIHPDTEERVIFLCIQILSNFTLINISFYYFIF